MANASKSESVSISYFIANIQEISFPPPKKIPRNNIFWSPPPSYCWKLNVDGSAIGKPGPAGVGAVLRDSSSKILFTLSKSIGVADSNLAELIAVVDALDCIHKSGMSPHPELFVESDSRVVISWIKDAKTRPWRYRSQFIRLHQILPAFALVHFTHIYREANHLADYFAKSGVNREVKLEAWL